MIEQTLKDRGRRYGDYMVVSENSQMLKEIFRASKQWDHLGNFQRESLDMIANKLARIMNGDRFYADSWTDIAGYATLVAQELKKRD
mgnify:CR=1 FL=1|tara:strand:+ start:332 stop:592 length:261 start_codon:yes stop_codon:yes gene_type:complete